MNISGFYEESTSNGDGWRAVLFVSGCPHKCFGCHNPETWDCNNGEPFDANKYLSIIKDNPILDGVTISGGEPFLYVDELIPFIKEVRKLGLDVWVYTGYTIEYLTAVTKEHYKKLLDLVDVLVDGRFEINKADETLRFRGSSNQRILDLNKMRKDGKI